MNEAPTADKLIDVIGALQETEECDVHFFQVRWFHCNNEEQQRDLIRSFRRQMLTVAAHTALERI